MIYILLPQDKRKGLSSRGPLRAPASGHPPPPLSRPGRCGQRGRPPWGLPWGPARPPAPAPAPRRPALPAGRASRRRRRGCPGRAGRRGPARHPLLLARSRTFCFSSQGQRTIKGAGEPLTGSECGCRHLLAGCTRVPRQADRTSLPPAPGRAARAPGSLRGRCRSVAFGVVGPAAPGASAAGSDTRARPASPQPRPLRSRGPTGRPGTASRRPAGPAAAAERLTARGAAASPAILCRVCVVSLSRLLSRLYSLLLLLPPPHTPHNMASSLRRRLRRQQQPPPRSCPLPSPTLPASRPQPHVPARKRATARPPRPLAPRASCLPFPGAASRTLAGVFLPPNNNHFKYYWLILTPPLRLPPCGQADLSAIHCP
ncbi:collagen alpha-1(I) chain-like [Mustela erminea]|uniref:collagen alpha-1(I) chain-like n=1 Tax=Mustela erminea TaxID=36723 RepID=UPI001386FDDF|nr:collagen alpha-1(I) chain-like [Mustela erminea]